MRLEVTIAYTPNLTYEATRMLPMGTTLKLGSKLAIEVPEIAEDDAPVAFIFRDDTLKGTWRRRGSTWLRPLGEEASYLVPHDPKPLDGLAFAGLVAAGYHPQQDELTGMSRMVPGNDVQAVAAGEALLGMLERRNPHASSQGRNRNIIDSGDIRHVEARTRLAWSRLGAHLVDGMVWQTVREPVLALQKDGRVLVLASGSAAAESAAKHDRLYAVEDWESLADNAEKAGLPRPRSTIEWMDGELSTAPSM